MNCIVIDDEETSRAIVSHLAENNPNVQLLDCFSSAINAIKYLNEYSIDLVFLDIHMPTFTGFDFIRTVKNAPKIILTTSDKDFALEAFEYECIIDYFMAFTVNCLVFLGIDGTGFLNPISPNILKATAF